MNISDLVPGGGAFDTPRRRCRRRWPPDPSRPGLGGSALLDRRAAGRLRCRRARRSHAEARGRSDDEHHQRQRHLAADRLADRHDHRRARHGLADRPARPPSPADGRRADLLRADLRHGLRHRGLADRRPVLLRRPRARQVPARGHLDGHRVRPPGAQCQCHHHGDDRLPRGRCGHLAAGDLGCGPGHGRLAHPLLARRRPGTGAAAADDALPPGVPGLPERRRAPGGRPRAGRALRPGRPGSGGRAAARTGTRTRSRLRAGRAPAQPCCSPVCTAATPCWCGSHPSWA